MKDLQVNSSWNFRITAVNAAGISDPFLPEDPITAGKRISKCQSFNEGFEPTFVLNYQFLFTGAPSAPRNFTPIDVTSRCVKLQWSPPENNGGSEVTGYILERKESTEETWTKVVTLESTVLQYSVENLREKSEFYFRVFAENAVGLSSPATTELVSLKTHASKLNLLRTPTSVA